MNDEMTPDKRNTHESPIEESVEPVAPNSDPGEASVPASAPEPPREKAPSGASAEASVTSTSSTPLGFDAIAPVAESKMHSIKDGLLNLALPILALTVSVVLILLVIVPMRRDLPALEDELFYKKTLAGRLAHKVDVLHELSNSHDTLSTYLSVVDSALASEPLVPELLAQVDTMARTNGMLVSGLNYSHGSSPKDGSLGYVTVALTSRGTFDSLVSFMHTVENARRLVFVDDFRYSSVYVDDVPQISVSFQLKSPYKKVLSDAVTDSPIDLDITSARFLQDIDRVKSLQLYEYVPSHGEPTVEDQPAPLDVPTEGVAPAVPESSSASAL